MFIIFLRERQFARIFGDEKIHIKGLSKELLDRQNNYFKSKISHWYIILNKWFLYMGMGFLFVGITFLMSCINLAISNFLLGIALLLLTFDMLTLKKID